jgi:hypothetical protein
MGANKPAWRRRSRKSGSKPKPKAVPLNDFEREKELAGDSKDTLGERIAHVDKGYTGQELKALMEAQWNRRRPQSSVHKARWLTPGKTGGYMINPEDKK